MQACWTRTTASSCNSCCSQARCRPTDRPMSGGGSAIALGRDGLRVEAGHHAADAEVPHPPCVHRLPPHRQLVHPKAQLQEVRCETLRGFTYYVWILWQRRKARGLTSPRKLNTGVHVGHHPTSECYVSFSTNLTLLSLLVHDLRTYQIAT